MSTNPIDNYSLVENLDPYLWEIILDILLLDTEDNDQFEKAFYPILMTFPSICCCDNDSPVKRYWMTHMNRIMANVAGMPLANLMDAYDDRMDHPKDLIEEDAERYNIDMAIRRGLLPKHVRFPNYNPWYNRTRKHKTTADLHTSNKRSKY